MIDLHTHTTHSDGTWSVAELLKRAQNHKIKILSITDHDSVDAYYELKKLDISSYFEGKIITGCEFNCVFDGFKIELLGYDFDLPSVNSWICKNYGKNSTKSNLQKEFNDLVKLCKKNGIKLRKSIDYNPEKEYPGDKIYSEILKNIENKKFYVKKGWENKGNFFRSYTNNKNFPLFINMLKYLPDAAEVSNIIKAAGGKVFVAHIFLYDLNDFWGYLDKLVKFNIIDGVEVWHSCFSVEQMELLKLFCYNNNLLMSCGSDAHGEKNPERKLGLEGLNLKVDFESVKNWISLN